MSIEAVTAVTGRPAPRALPLAQRALDRRVERVQVDAERARRGVVARQQVVLERLHERADQRGVLAGDRRGDHGGDRRQRDAEFQRRAADHHGVGDTGDHGGVGHHVGAGDVPRPGGGRRRGRGTGKVVQHVAAVDRRGPVSAPRRQGHHRKALDEPDEEAERARAGADHDRGAQRDPLRDRAEQRALHGQAGAEVAGERGVRGTSPRGRRRAAAPRAPPRRRTSPPRCARARRSARQCPPSSGSGSTRRRCRPAPRRARLPSSRRRSPARRPGRSRGPACGRSRARGGRRPAGGPPARRRRSRIRR